PGRDRPAAGGGRRPAGPGAAGPAAAAAEAAVRRPGLRQRPAPGRDAPPGDRPALRPPPHPARERAGGVPLAGGAVLRLAARLPPPAAANGSGRPDARRLPEAGDLCDLL